MRDQDDPPNLRLRAIANILHIPIERFFDAEATPRSADTDECLQLWLRLRTNASRAAALVALRGIAEQEGD